MGLRDAALGGHAERDVEHRGPGHADRHRVVSEAPLERAVGRQQLVASLEVDEQDAHHARLRDALRVGPEPPDVAGVAGRNGAHAVRRRGVEREVRRVLAHELAEAVPPVDHGQAAPPVDDDGVRVHEQLSARDLVDVVGELAHSVGALAAAVGLHQGRRHAIGLRGLGSVGSQQLRDPALEGDRLDLHA